MEQKRGLLIFVFSLVSVLVAMSQVSIYAPQSQMPEVKNDTLEVSLITKYPAAEVYELYGHEAVRVKSSDFDLAFDYGLFDFDAPNFIYRFVKGETDYMAGCHDFPMFMAACEADGAMVVEQRLNLTQEESHRLLELLLWDVRPENRRYRYNYVKNNCATKILERIDQAVGETIDYNDSIRFGSYRKELTHYGRNYDWYQFGVDLILGSGLDYELSRREEMFVPVELMMSASKANLKDGRKLVSEEKVIYEGRGDMTLDATPFLVSPLFIGLLLLVVISFVTIRSLIKGRICRWTYILWYGVCGIAGCLVFFMVFVSEHEATSPNINIWWLNPLALIVPVMAWSRRMGKVIWSYMALNTLVIAIFLISLPFQNQVLNVAVYPLIFADFMLSAGYLINKSNKNIWQSKTVKQK